MAFKNYKKGLKRPQDEALELTRHWTYSKLGWPWKKRGSWKQLEPRRHPGWAAYHANKNKE